MKIAKIVIIQFVTRVIVDELDSEDFVIAKAAKNIQEKIHNGEVAENVENIFEDKEQPFDAMIDYHLY